MNCMTDGLTKNIYTKDIIFNTVALFDTYSGQQQLPATARSKSSNTTGHGTTPRQVLSLG